MNTFLHQHLKDSLESVHPHKISSVEQFSSSAAFGHYFTMFLYFSHIRDPSVTASFQIAITHRYEYIYIHAQFTTI